MVLLELSAIFGQSLFPVLIVVGALAIIWTTVSVFYKWLMRAIHRGRDHANEEFDREVRL